MGHPSWHFLTRSLAADPAEEFALDTTKEPYKTALANIMKALAAQMKSVNTTFQSVVDQSQAPGAEPCTDYAKGECRTGVAPTPPSPPTPPPPPTPPSPPSPPPTPGSGKCTFQAHTGFEKGRQIPGHRSDPAATEQACCDLCAAIEGCQGASFTNGQCYYKNKGEMKPHPLAAATAVFGTWSPSPPAPPPAKCSAFTTKDTCPARCVWDAATNKCTATPPPPPPPPSPPPPPPAPLPPAPPPFTPPACAVGIPSPLVVLSRMCRKVGGVRLCLRAALLQRTAPTQSVFLNI